jgi:hypothetical protein
MFLTADSHEPLLPCTLAKLSLNLKTRGTTMKKRLSLFHRQRLASVLFKPRAQRLKLYDLRTRLIFVASLCVCFLLVSPPSQAQNQSRTFIAHGPVSFVRGEGAPTPVTTTFNVLDLTTTFSVRIDSSGVSNALIKLNGIELFKPADFNANIRLLAKPVKLLATNQLTVELRGKPGESLSLQIIGVDNIAPTITGIVTPAPNTAGWNKSNATVSFTCADTTSGIASCTEPVTITEETLGQPVNGMAFDNAGNSASVLVTVKLDKTPPTLNITSPVGGAKIFASPIGITGTVAETLSGLESVTCNGTPATVTGDTFACGVPLTPGSNSISVRATDIAGNSSDPAPLSLIFAPVPKVTFTSPSHLSFLNLSPTTVTGTVDDPTATLTINSITAPVANGQFSIMLPLAEGPNIVTATATSAAGAVGNTSIEVTLDTTPPHVTITSPTDKFVTTEAAISISGNVNDIVVGTVNDQQAQVTVAGHAAQVANRTFLATAVPLQMGPNVIQAVARDRVGNSAITQIVITREAVTQAQIRLVSGNNQSAIIGTTLPSPMLVALTDADGNPVANKPVIFKVTQDDGTVSTGDAPAASAIAVTDAQGLAQAQWKLGMRAGAGANSVEAYSVGFAGTAIFAATGTLGPPGKIVVDTGNNQVGEINQPLPKPLIAVLVDSGDNRLGGVPVTFTVKEGGGSFNGQPNFTVLTDSDGRAAATLTLGLQEGNANHLVEANFPSNQSFPASFAASGRAPGDAAKTSISGVVLDNSNVPIPGVTIRAVLTQVLNANLNIVQTAAAVQTDTQGQFTIQQAPVGFVKLLVDGSTAERPGTFPTLDYDMVTVAGLNNTLGMPIFLLPLNPNNQLCVTATSGGGTLTVPEAPGFSLTFGPGQVTFPGGSKTGCISVTVVHPDKVPMSPGFGQQPRFIVTIQPAGAIFNPPARITLPNVDGLRPRSVTEMYSFDHDIGSFVAIGTGTVSDDGQVIGSNPGIGVLKAGWHCGGNPNSQGSSGSLKVTINNPIKLQYGANATVTASGTPPLDGRYLNWTVTNSNSDAKLAFNSQPDCPNNPSCANTLNAPELELGTESKGFKACGTADAQVSFKCTTTGQTVTGKAKIEVGCGGKSAADCSAICNSEAAQGMCGTPCSLLGVTPPAFDPNQPGSCWKVNVAGTDYCYWDHKAIGGKGFVNLCCPNRCFGGSFTVWGQGPGEYVCTVIEKCAANPVFQGGKCVEVH